MGPWQERRIKNPNFKGKWSAPVNDNLEVEVGPDLHVFPNLKYVAFELWQYSFICDNIIICDDPEYVLKLAEETWGKNKDIFSSKDDEGSL